MAFKKYIQRPLLLFCILVLVTTVVFFPVSAVTIGRNNFYDYDQFATYSFDKDTGLVTADLSLPADWFWTRYRDSHNYQYLYNGLSFFIDEPENGTSRTFELTFNPFFRNFNFTAAAGYFITDAKLLDLTYIPLNSTLTFGIEFHLYDDELDIDKTHVGRIVFVDEEGYVVSYEPMDLTIHQAYLGGDTYSFGLEAEYTFTSVPSNARGFYYIFNSSFYNLARNAMSVSITKNNLTFAYSNIELDLNNNKIVRNSLSNIQNQLGDLVNGSPEQNEAVDGAVDQMQQAGDDLKDLGSSMSNVPKPDPGDINVSIDQFVSPGTMLAYTQPFLSLWENPTMLSMLIIVLTLVLVSWVMFGKKGG